MSNVDTYFDVVLDRNDKVLFNGTEAEVKEWLNKHRTESRVSNAAVCLGKTLTYTSIKNYLGEI
jgi:hypothetical protein